MGESPNHPQTRVVDFRISEYNALRVELMNCIDAIKAIETETIIGAGAIYAWLFAKDIPTVPGWFKFFLSMFPFFLTTINWLRVVDRVERIFRIADYIRAVENYLDSEIVVDQGNKQYKVKGWKNLVGKIRPYKSVTKLYHKG